MVPQSFWFLFLLLSSEVHAFKRISSAFEEDRIFREENRQASFIVPGKSVARFVLRVQDVLPENDFGQLTITEFIRNECRAAQISLEGQNDGLRSRRWAPFVVLGVIVLVAFLAGGSAYVVLNEIDKGTEAEQQQKFFEEVERRLERLGNYTNKNARWTLRLTERLEGLELSSNVLPSITALFTENKIDPALFFMADFKKLMAEKLEVDIEVVSSFFPLLVARPIACHPDNSILIEVSYPTTHTPASVVEVFDAGHIVDNTYWFFKEMPRSIVQFRNGSYATFEEHKCSKKTNLTICPTSAIQAAPCNIDTLKDCPSVLKRIPDDRTLHRETLQYHLLVPNRDVMLVYGAEGITREALVKGRVNIVSVALHHTAQVGELKLYPTPHLQTEAFSMVNLRNLTEQMQRELDELRKSIGNEEEENRLDIHRTRQIAQDIKQQGQGDVFGVFQTWKTVKQFVESVIHYVILIVVGILGLTVMYLALVFYRCFCRPIQAFGRVGS